MADLDAVDVAHGIEAAALTAVTRAAASRNAYVPFTSRQVIAGAVLDAVRDLLIQEGRRQAEADLVQARAEVARLEAERDEALSRYREQLEATRQLDDLRMKEIVKRTRERDEMQQLERQVAHELGVTVAERDEARHERDLWQAEHATALAVIEAVKAERDQVRAELSRAVEDWGRNDERVLAALASAFVEGDAMRPVVEAAGRLLDTEADLDEADSDSGEWKAAEQERDHAWDALLDAYNAHLNIVAVAQMAQPVVAAPLISADPTTIPHITVRKFAYHLPVARAACETCGEALIYNLAVSPELLEHVAADSTCTKPWPAVTDD